MIRVHCQKGLFVEAKEMLMKMEENGCLPNSVTYNVIVQEFLKQNECRETEVLLEEMVNKGFSPDATTFSMLLSLIPKVGQGLLLF